MPAYGGIYPNTAVMKNILAAQGVTAPHNGQPYSEAMLLGIGGGLGAGYILWEFKSHGSASIVMGFTNRWNYVAERMTLLCQRLGYEPTVQETSGVKAAAAYLQAALDAGAPFVAWTDKACLPHHALPERLKGYDIHVVGVHGTDGDQIIVDDLAEKLFTVPRDVFAEARNQIPSDKNRLLITGKSSAIDLPAAVMTGLRDHVEHLERDSESFSLPVYKKWAKLMTDAKNKKGWPTVFKSRNGLYGTLRSVHEGITLNSSDGYGLRALYADFLDEAAPIVNKPALRDAANAYRKAGDVWVAAAEAALPDSVPLLAETKSLMQARYDHYNHNRIDALRDTMTKLNALEEAHKQEFPLDDAAVIALFADLSDKLNAVYEAEVAALAVLSEALKA